MSNLVVFDFDGIHTADEVLNKLRSLPRQYLGEEYYRAGGLPTVMNELIKAAASMPTRSA